MDLNSHQPAQTRYPEWIISGSALNCTHSLSYTQSYVDSAPAPDGVDNGQLLSIVYAIQETTVV